MKEKAICSHPKLSAILPMPKRWYEFCQRGALKHSGRSCRTDGNWATVRTCRSANQQVGFWEMLGKYVRGNSPF